MRFIYTILGLLLLLSLLGFALKNAEPVELHYYLGVAWRAPLSLMLLVTFFFGVIAGAVACLASMISQRRRLMALQRELKTLNANIQP